MSFLFYDAVMKVLARMSISSPQPFWWLSVDWTNILVAITSCDEEDHQDESEAHSSIRQRE
jgi:hypothetical protein